MTASEQGGNGTEPADGPADRPRRPNAAAPPPPTASAPPAASPPQAPPTNGEDAPAHESTIPTVHIREMRQGHRPGERYVRIRRPFHETFREASGDTLVAREKV